MKFINVFCLLIGVTIIATLVSDLSVPGRIFVIMMLVSGMSFALASKYVTAKSDNYFVSHPTLQDIRRLKKEELSFKYLIVSALCVFSCLPLIG